MTRVVPARRVAYDVIRAVSDSDAYANLLLPVAIERANLSTQDAAFCTELCYGTLRGSGRYDAIIDAAASRSTVTMDPAVRDALRLGTHQLLAMRVPSYAAINETVQLVGRKAAGFANAVLRNIDRNTAEEWDERVRARLRSDDERLAFDTAHPVWVIRALRRALDAEGRRDELSALLEADNIAPEVSLVALPGMAEKPASAAPAHYSPYGAVLSGGDPESVISDSAGKVRVQDEGSQLVALALSRAQPVRAGERWLDLCAGPGGKTALLAAEALHGGAVLEANELVPHRAELVRKALAPLGLDVEVHERDGRELAESAGQQFDRILLDAPCTGLGALRRRPEARWRKQSSDVTELTKVQEELLNAALRALRVGGVLAYVTCSPHLSETRDIVSAAQRRWAERVSLVDARPILESFCVSPLDLPPAEGLPESIQLWPHRHGTDAMFLTLFRRETEENPS